MTYMCQCSGGICIDHHEYIKSVYQRTKISAQDEFQSFRFQHTLFLLENPHIKEAFLDKNISVSNLSTPESEYKRRRRKRKRKCPVTDEERLAIEYHEKVKDKHQASFEVLSCVAKEHFFISSTVGQLKEETYSIKLEKGTPFSLKRMNNCVISNENSFALLTKHEDKQVLIPANCRFVQSDVKDLSILLDDCERNKKKYSCVLMDPPWRNKSVKRGSKYKWLDFEQIKKLPVPALTRDNGIVAVWVTNKTSVIRFVSEELFAHWNVKMLGKWFWLKVTSRGKLIYPLDSLHKKPYEMLMIGQYSSTTSNSILSCKQFEEQVFCSVPCKIHSHKPPVYKWLEDLVCHENPLYLEMFSRNLTPNWTSWGNEVLMLQDSCFYECAHFV